MTGANTGAIMHAFIFGALIAIAFSIVFSIGKEIVVSLFGLLFWDEHQGNRAREKWFREATPEQLKTYQRQQEFIQRMLRAEQPKDERDWMQDFAAWAIARRRSKSRQGLQPAQLSRPPS